MMMMMMMMMMMVPSKTKSGSIRLNRNGSTKSDGQPLEKHSSPLPKPRGGSIDRPTKSFESKVCSKNSTSAGKPGLQEKLEAVEAELKKAREQLSSVEQEKIKALEHMNEAKSLADEMNEEVEKATVARMRAEEILDAERCRIKELEEELQKERQHLRSRHEQDMSSLSCMAEELHRVKEELRGAKGEKEMILREVDDAKRAAKAHEQEAELASKEACDLKALHESELGSVHRESREMIEKLKAEIGTLKSELERAKIAEEKLIHMESLVEKLQIEATDARNGESDVCALVDEWRNKAEKLKADLEEAYQSEKSASDSLADMMVKLEETKSLFEDAEMEISILRATINTLEIESARQKIDLEESNRQLELAQQDALNIGKTVELLKLELQRLEEENLETGNVEKVVSSRIESLAEENDKLTAELKISKDEGEKANKAMECLALELKAKSIEAKEREERLTRMQTEIEESRKEIDHLSRVLRNTEERYEVMLDEARYELVCLQRRCKDEQNFIGTIQKLEEEIASLKAQMAKRVKLQEIDKQEKNESIEEEDVAKLLSVFQRVESQLNSSPNKEEPSKNGNLELSETILDEKNEVQGSEALNTEVEYTEEDHYQEGHNMKDPMKVMDNGSRLEERHREEKTVDDDLDSKMNFNGVNHIDGTEQLKLQKKKKKTLLYNFGNLLKKGNH